ncbi:MAG: gamma-glutamyltransferase [Pseudomonadota bacterium]
MLRLSVLLVCLWMMAVPPVSAGDRVSGDPLATRSEVIAVHGMAATSHPLATQVALDILKAGGNAVDAAIAANAALGLMEPTGNGIGGDLFAIVWDQSTQTIHGLNASGRSPATLTLDYLIEQGLDKIPSHGPLPVSVPGAVDGWFELHEKFGKLPMDDILEPSIRYAEHGFPVTELIAYYWNRSVPILSKFPGFSEVFMPNGVAPKKGQVFKNPDLANTYRILAKEGRDGFYKGHVAQTMADYMQANGGFLTVDDLANHTSEWVEPLSTNYRGYEVYELPPNGQGLAALQMLNILEGFDLADMGFGSADYLHVLTEAKKLAFEDRAKFYSDPAFNTLPIDALLSKEYAASQRARISMKRASKQLPAYDGALEEGDTIYLTTADQDGNMVSLIQSNYRGMGSGMTPPGLGFVLQDRGELFSLDPDHFNVYEPAKRPFHTIIPAFVTKDGKPFMSFGLMGGAMQPQGHVQILVNMIDFGMNTQVAGDAPRLRHEGSSQPTGEVMTDGGRINLETGYDAKVVKALRRRGHTVKVGGSGYGGYQAIRYDAEHGVYVGASESRKDGQAAGY